MQYGRNPLFLSERTDLGVKQLRVQGAATPASMLGLIMLQAHGCIQLQLS